MVDSIPHCLTFRVGIIGNTKKRFYNDIGGISYGVLIFFLFVFQTDSRNLKNAFIVFHVRMKSSSSHYDHYRFEV